MRLQGEPAHAYISLPVSFLFGSRRSANRTSLNQIREKNQRLQRRNTIFLVLVFSMSNSFTNIFMHLQYNKLLSFFFSRLYLPKCCRQLQSSIKHLKNTTVVGQGEAKKKRKIKILTDRSSTRKKSSLTIKFQVVEVNGKMNGKSKAKGNEKRKYVVKGRKESKDLKPVFVASNCESNT